MVKGSEFGIGIVGMVIQTSMALTIIRFWTEGEGATLSRYHGGEWMLKFFAQPVPRYPFKWIILTFLYLYWKSLITSALNCLIQLFSNVFPKKSINTTS